MERNAAQDVWRMARTAVGWLLLALFASMVLLWTLFGLAPRLVDLSPEPFQEFGRTNAFWPILAGFLAGGGAAWALAPGLRLEGEAAETGEASGVKLSPLAAALLGPAALLMMFSAYWPCAGGEQPFWSALRHALEALEGYVAEPFGQGVPGCPAEFPQGLMAGVLFGRITLVLVLGIGLTYVFRHSVDSLRARTARRLVIFAGLSDETSAAARLVRRNLTPGQRLALLAAGEEIGLARTLAREMGCLVLAVDVSDEEMITAFVRARGRRRIQGLYLMSADSATNLRAMETFMKATKAVDRKVGSGQGSEVPSRVLVRVDNPWHAEDWRRKQMVGHPGWLFDAISVHEMAARHVVERIKQQSPPVDAVVIAGSSSFELAVLSELSFEHRLDAYLSSVSSEAEEAWDVVSERRPYRPYVGRTPRAVLVGAKAGVAAAHYRERLAQFGIPKTRRLFDVEQHAPYESVMADLLKDGRIPALVTNDTPEDDATFLAVRHPTWTIFDWDDSVQGVTQEPLMGGLYLVGPTVEPIADFGLDIWDRLGSVQHRIYTLNYLGGSLDDADRNGKRGRWEGLSAFAKESNIRSFAAFCRSVATLRRPRKLATALNQPVGEHAAPLSPIEVHELAIREHESWVRHHVEHGYRWGPERAGKRHPDIRPWADLDDLEKQKDVTSVQATNDLLAALGFVLADATPRSATE